MNQVEVHTTNTSPAEAKIRVERFFGSSIFIDVLAWVCMSLCTEKEKEKGYIAAEACSEETCGKSSLKLQQPCKNCSGSTNYDHRSDINRS